MSTMITAVRNDMDRFSDRPPAICGALTLKNTAGSGQVKQLEPRPKLHMSDTQPTKVKPDMPSGGGPQMDNHP